MCAERVSSTNVRYACGSVLPARRASGILTVMTNTAWLFWPGLLAVLLAHPGSGQSLAPLPPVIDAHFHGGEKDFARTDSLNVRYRLATVLPVNLEAWQSVDRTRVVTALHFPCDRGRAPMFGVPCLPNGADLPDTSWVRTQLKAGRIQAFAEIISQYVGMSPDDPRFDPYWSIAEEFDVPVGIHMGYGPPNAAYESSPTPVKTPEYRAAYGNPMLLENVLMRHKKLRVSVMHAGWPMLESMIALLYAHPNVFVDVAGLQAAYVPRASYYRHLRGLVEAGFAKRIMFGSDSPGSVLARRGIDAILDADFLTAEQKADILCGNAQRFLRLAESTCRP